MSDTDTPNVAEPAGRDAQSTAAPQPRRRPMPYKRTEEVDAEPTASPAVGSAQARASVEVPAAVLGSTEVSVPRRAEPSVAAPAGAGGGTGRESLAPASAETETGGADGHLVAGRWSRSTVVLVSVAAVVILGLIGLVVQQSVKLGDNDARDENRRTALTQAAEAVGVVWSYDYRTFDRDLQAALAVSTGGFQADYRAVAQRLTKPTVKAGRIVTKSTVTDASIVSATDDAVVVLLFVDQTTSGKKLKKSSVGLSARATMTRVGGQWLLSDLDSL